MQLIYPSDFEKLLSASLPEQELTPLLDSLQWPSHTSVRLNTKKNAKIKSELDTLKVPYCEDGYILKNRPEFVADPAFHAGYYYVQEASSMIVGSLVSQLLKKIEPSATLLDLCAAPGGKSTHISSVLRQNDVLIANEVIQTRTPVLKENLNKWGAGNYIITRADALKFATGNALFDIIVADLPCSGEGLFRKDPMAIQQWSENNVILCSARQKRICHDIWPALKPGGYFIYSTCTFNKMENEDNIAELCKSLDAELVDLNIPEGWNLICTTKGNYRLLPHRTPGEGFFFAILRKKNTETVRKKSKQKYRANDYNPFKLPFPVEGNFSMYEKNGDVFVMKCDEMQRIFSLFSELPHVYEPGTAIGKSIKKKNETQFKPFSSLSLMPEFLQNIYPKLTLNDQEIMSWLHRGSLPNTQAMSGIHEVYWRSVPVGFANGINHQWNNLWPMEWRVRKENLITKTILDLPE